MYSFGYWMNKVRRYRKTWPTLHVGRSLAVRVYITIFAIIGLILPPQSGLVLASGVYTTSTSDADGNALLASNSVKAVQAYDTTGDATPAVKKQLGIDPNWQNGVDRQSSALQFNGGGYVSVSDAPQFAIGTGDYTIELWFKTGSSCASFCDLASKRTGSPMTGIGLYIFSDNKLKFDQWNNGSSLGVVSSIATVNDGSWHQATAVRYGGTLLLYVDGALQQSAASAQMSETASGAALAIGAYSSGGSPFTGYIDEVRLSKMARQTGGTSFSPVRRLVEDTNTVGLWHFDEGSGTNVNDSSGYAATGSFTGSPAATWVSGSNAIMDGFAGCSPDGNGIGCGASGQTGAGNVQVASTSSTSSQKSYEVQVTSSPGLQFDGSAAYITVANGSSFGFADTSFTAETWFATTSNGVLLAKNGVAGGGWVVSINSGSVTMSLKDAAGANVVLASTSSGYADGKWHHVAAVTTTSTTVATNNSVVLYVDGVVPAQTVTKSGTTYADVTAPLTIGEQASTNFFAGTLDEVRISSGVRYSGPFTPSHRLATDGKTAGLWHFDEGSGVNTADTSGNGNTGVFMNGASNSPAADGISLGPIWTTGLAGGGQISSTAWLLPGYQFRKKLSVAAGSSAVAAGYVVESTENRAGYMNALQARPDGNDWRLTYQPADQYRSLAFNGTSQYASIPDSPSTNLGTSDFTVDFWMKTSATCAGFCNVLQKRDTSGSAAGFEFFQYAAGGQVLVFQVYINGVPAFAQTKAPINDGRWHHVLGLRKGSLVQMYLDGVLQGSATHSQGAGSITPASSVPLRLGASSVGLGVFAAVQLDELRLSNVARVTGNFIPQTTAYQADGNTVGLWHLHEGSGQYLIDSSSNANNGILGADSGAASDDPTWTAGDGVVSVAREISRSIPKGHSLILDGTNDYLAVSNNAALSPGNNDVTVEGWVKPTQVNSVDRTIYSDYGSNGSIINLSLTAGNVFSVQFGDGSGHATTIFGTSTPVVNTWYHVAGVRQSNRFTLFVNGTAEASQYVGTIGAINVSDGVAPTIGMRASDSTAFWAGQIDELRVSNTARYRNSFTVTSAPLAADSKTAALWHFDDGTGTSVTDQSTNGLTATFLNGTSNSPAADGVTNGPIWLSNAGAIDSTNQTDFRVQSPIGSSASDASYYLYFGKIDELGALSSFVGQALRFDGVNAAVTVPKASSINNLANYTFSAWVNVQAPTVNGRIFDKGHTLFYSNNTLSFAQSFTSGSYNWSTDIGTLSYGVWHQVVITYDNSSVSNNPIIYIDGVSKSLTRTGTASGTANGDASNDFLLGNNSALSRGLVGQMDDARLYNRLLSSTEVTALYSNQAVVAENGLVGWWRFNATAGLVVSDSSSSNNTGQLSGCNFNNSSGWTLNQNLLKNSFESVVTTQQSEQESPSFFRWRDISPDGTLGSWSTASQISATGTALGSSGVTLKFNPTGLYSLYDDFIVRSWAVESFTTSSPQRGKRRSFPDKAHLIASSGGLDIIDASTNILWMRLPLGSNNVLGASAPTSLAALNGHMYLGSSSGLYDIDLAGGTVKLTTNTGTARYQGNMASRAAGNGFAVASGVSAVATAIQGVAATVLTVAAGPEQSVAVATTGGLSLLRDTTGNPVSLTYAKTAADAYTAASVTSGGKLYGANTTESSLDRYDAVENDTGDQVGSTDASYSTTTTPALRNGSINQISVTESTSTSDYASNTVALATNGGAETIQENTTFANGIIEHAIRAGSSGSSNWSSRQFGGALEFTGSTFAQITTGTPFQLGDATFTVEGWVRTSSADGTVIGKAGNGGWYLGVQGGKLVFVARDSSGNPELQRLSSNLIDDGVWHHVAAVVTTSTTTAASNTVQLYVDGKVNQGSLTQSGGVYATTSDTLYFGRQTSGNYYTGLLDEVRISSNARYGSNSVPSRTEFARDATTLGLWHFDQRTGQSVFDDSANSADGVLGATSSPGLDDALRVSPSLGGIADSATTVGLGTTSDPGTDLSFLGASNQSFQKTSFSSITNDVTYAVWVKLGATSSDQVIMYQSQGINKLQLWYTSASSKLRLRTCSASTCGSDLTANSTLTQGVWTFVVATRNSLTGEACIYINGQLDASVGGTNWSVPSTTLRIGSDDAHPFTGQLDDIRVYNRALTGSEAAGLYNSGMGRTDNPYSNLVAWYALNEGSGTSLSDSSGVTGAASFVVNPTWSTGSPVRGRSALWVGTDGGAVDDGAVTDISQMTARQVTTYVYGTSLLPAGDISSLAVGRGGLAIIGTSTRGAWAPDWAGIPVDDTIQNIVATSQGVDIKRGTIQIKGGTVQVTSQ